MNGAMGTSTERAGQMEHIADRASTMITASVGKIPR